MRLIVLCAILGVSSAFAQTPPTATEAFNLRIKCKEMVDRKGKDFHTPSDGQEVISTFSSSRYDPRSNRCFGDFQHRMRTPSLGLDQETRVLFDMQIDDVIASWQIVNGKKLGVVIASVKKLRRPIEVGTMPTRTSTS